MDEEATAQFSGRMVSYRWIRGFPGLKIETWGTQL
jgi:hypothetical protein